MKEGYPSGPQTKIQWAKGIGEEKETRKERDTKTYHKACCDVILIQSKSATWTYKIHDLLKKLHKKAEIVNVSNDGTMSR